MKKKEERRRGQVLLGIGQQREAIGHFGGSAWLSSARWFHRPKFSIYIGADEQ